MIEPLVESWRINDRINRYFLESLTPEQWEAPLGKGKTVRNQFGHIHNVRLMWLKAAAPELMEGLEKLEGDTTKDAVVAAMQASGGAIARLIERSGTPDGRVKNFKPHVTAFVCYMTSHEAFHR